MSLKNIGNEPISLTFIFSAPGFDDTMRCNSVPDGETPTQITPEQQKDCAHLGHAENASRQEQPKRSHELNSSLTKNTLRRKPCRTAGTFSAPAPLVPRMTIPLTTPASSQIRSNFSPLKSNLPAQVTPTAVAFVALGGPPYNLSLQDRPFLRPREGYRKTIEEDFHWHLEILPQLIGLTGFERASWFSYNPVPPETAARCLSG